MARLTSAGVLLHRVRDGRREVGGIDSGHNRQSDAGADPADSLDKPEDFARCRGLESVQRQRILTHN